MFYLFIKHYFIEQSLWPLSENPVMRNLLTKILLFPHISSCTQMHHKSGNVFFASGQKSSYLNCLGCPENVNSKIRGWLKTPSRSGWWRMRMTSISRAAGPAVNQSNFKPWARLRSPATRGELDTRLLSANSWKVCFHLLVSMHLYHTRQKSASLIIIIWLQRFSLKSVEYFCMNEPNSFIQSSIHWCIINV